MKICDLHTHTNASDGELSPYELLIEAKKRFDVLGVADHDTLKGVKVILNNDEGIEIIHGCELSCRDGKRDIHLLTYLPDFGNSEIESYLRKFREVRRERIGKIITKLNKTNIRIDFQDVVNEAGGNVDSLGRPHLARVMVKKGFVKDIQEAFDRYISVNAPFYVPKFKISPEEAINIILKSRGIPVYAHPGVEYDIEYIYYLSNIGLMGIEVWHPDHTPEIQARLIEICKKKDLLFTGGSDFHGFKHDSKNVLGKITVPYDIVTRLKKKKAEL